MPTATRTRIKKTVAPAITSRAGFEELIGTLSREIILQRATKVAMDDEIAVIRQKYEPELAEIDERVADGLALAQEYCDANPDLFSKDRKSLDTVHAIVGYRTGMPRLKTLRGWTWDRVLEGLTDNRVMRWIRTKKEVNKEAIIADKDAKPEVLAHYGMLLVQDETFFVDPKLEQLEARLKS